MSISSAPSATASSTSRDLDVERALAGRERRRDRGDLDAAPGEPLDRRRARGSGRRRRRPPTGTFGSDGSGRIAFEQSAATLPGVSWPSSVVRSQQRIASSSAQSFDSRLDAALRELGGARLDADLVDRADPRQPLLQRQLEPGRQRGRLRHAASVALAGRGPSAGGRRNVSGDETRGSAAAGRGAHACLPARRAACGLRRQARRRHHNDRRTTTAARRRSARPPTTAR